MTKPVVGYVAGLTAPKGRRMGHAGAIISAVGDSAAEKAEIMRSCGLTVAPSPSELGSTVARVLSARGAAPVRSQAPRRLATPALPGVEDVRRHAPELMVGARSPRACHEGRCRAA